MAGGLHIANYPVKGPGRFVCIFGDDLAVSHLQTIGMSKKDKKPKRPKNNLRAWREAMKLTQPELADKIGTSKAVISLLESGSRGLSDKWLRRLAPALQTRPGWLLDHTPEEVPKDLLDAVKGIAPEDQKQALEILETFAKRAKSRG